ncbi:MAG: glycosyl hydrolase family 17 protein [Gammaproteobacteria bacterium]
MSNPYRRKLSLAGIDATAMSQQELQATLQGLLEDGIHGLCFSPYCEGQGPGTALEEAQISERLDIVRPTVKWIRTFSCKEGNELTPRLATACGLKTMVGVWLDEDLEKNEIELGNGIELARAGHADILAVGNEVLLRGELSEDALLEYIQRAKQAVPSVPVGYVDAYFKFVDYPRITSACDVLLANCYPFWEGCPAEYALPYMKDMYRRVIRVADGKPVIISETGWPSTGVAFGGAIPSFRNAIKYFIDTYQWAAQEGIDVFYFSAFDEAWKVADEGDVGAYWGLWDKDGQPKFF